MIRSCLPLVILLWLEKREQKKGVGEEARRELLIIKDIRFCIICAVEGYVIDCIEIFHISMIISRQVI